MQKLWLTLLLLTAGSAHAEMQCFESMGPGPAIYFAWPANGAGGLAFFGSKQANGELATGDAHCRAGAPSRCVFGNDGVNGFFMFAGVTAKISMNGELKIEADDEGLNVTSVPSAAEHNYEFQSVDLTFCSNFVP